jgi:hypothetical protein
LWLKCSVRLFAQAATTQRLFGTIIERTAGSSSSVTRIILKCHSAGRREFTGKEQSYAVFPGKRSGRFRPFRGGPGSFT